ncbi:putative membrane protein [Salana multivorans]|uniref:Putative membrane protein n=1 Tax=Salana multivorans TaxID=120377 RepID=A0A3N2DCR3_9MICO|nr:DUF1003 domain-containing protein [Salana multivorans]MBN8880923.1 DUF1003 domain-containing protein [Salana multivorans]ROR97502.1 putative membrane protein [Salana multivorans]
MAERGQQRDRRLDTPLERGRWFGSRPRGSKESDTAGILSERIARFLGTPSFIIWLTVFCIVWLAWNTLAARELRFDSAANGFTALTLMLSLQASYAAPLILLAQNRQTDRDRIAAEQDRQRTERNLADTEYLAREMASLRMALQDVATRDYVRGELRDLLDALREDIRTEVRAELRAELHGEERVDEPAGKRTDRRKKKRPSSPEHADGTDAVPGPGGDAEPDARAEPTAEADDA